MTELGGIMKWRREKLDSRSSREWEEGGELGFFFNNFLMEKVKNKVGWTVVLLGLVSAPLLSLIYHLLQFLYFFAKINKIQINILK